MTHSRQVEHLQSASPPASSPEKSIDLKRKLVLERDTLKLEIAQLKEMYRERETKWAGEIEALKRELRSAVPLLPLPLSVMTFHPSQRRSPELRPGGLRLSALYS
jgi:hypothetical protein